MNTHKDKGVKKIKESFEKKFPYGGIIIEDNGIHYGMNDMWTFFESHLLKHRQELIKEIEGMRKIYRITDEADEYTYDTRTAYNQALNDIINLLTQSKGGENMKPKTMEGNTNQKGGKSKCLLTITGKHMFREVFDGYKEARHEGTTMIGVPKTLFKCIACGMIDDQDIKTGL